MISRRSYDRLTKVTYLWIAVFFIIIIKLFYIQVVKGSEYKNKALRSQQKRVFVPAQRGSIIDRNGIVLAKSVCRDAYGCYPDSLNNVERQTVDSLFSVIAGTQRGDIEKRLQGRKKYTIIATKIKKSVEDTLWKVLQADSIFAINRHDDYERIYPYGVNAANLLGYVGEDRGLSGIEFYFDSLLAGKGVWRTVFVDGNRKSYTAFSSDKFPLRFGSDVQLTIDINIQRLLDAELMKAVEENKAKSGFAAAVNPTTGEILAISSYPTFNPNKWQDYPNFVRQPHVVTDSYEPGSTFKLVVLAALLNKGIFKETDSVYCENGLYRYYGDYKIRDVHHYGWLTNEEVFIHSSNIGTVKLSFKLTSEELYKTATDFGFGALTDIELPGEAKGMLKRPSSWSRTTRAVFPFGQEVMVNTLQMLAAYAAIANDGVLMKLHIVKKITDAKGNVVLESHPQRRRNVVSPNVAHRIKKILQKVVEEGTGKSARVGSIPIAGKTGTAQKAINGRYSRHKMFATFVGFAPVESPSIAAIIVVNEPIHQYASIAAAPYFGEFINELALQKAELFSPLEKSYESNQSRKVTVPNVVMLTRSQTENLLESKRIKALFKCEGDFVMKQIPPAGSLIYPDATLVLQLGKPSVAKGIIPDVKGFPIRAAIAAFSRLKLGVNIKGSGFVKEQYLSADSLHFVLVCSERREDDR